MNKCKLLSTLLLVVLLFTTCKDKTRDKNFLNAIPDNAVLVIEVKNQQIYQKGVEGFSSLIGVIQNIIPDLKIDLNEFTNILTGEDTSFGIKIDKSYIYSAPTNKARKEFLGAFVAEVSDRAKLEAQIAKMNPELKIIKNSDHSLINYNSSVFAWNDNVLLIMGGDFEDSDLDAALMLDPESSLVANDDFKKFLKNKDDLAFWVGANQIISNLPSGFPKESMEIWQDSYMHFGLNFNLGNIKMTMNMEPESKFHEFNKKHKLIKDNFDNSILELFPSESLFAFKLSLNVKNYLSFLKGMPEISKLLDQNAKVSEVLESMEGDIFFSLYDVKNLIPQMALAFTMKKDNINELNSLLSESITISSKKNYQYFNMFGQNVYLGNLKDKVYVTNDEQGITTSLDKGYPDNIGKSPLSSLYKKYPSVMYLCLDPDKFPKELQYMLGSNRKAKDLIQFLSSCEYLVVYSDIATNHVEIQFKDEEKNALNIILEYIQKQIK